MSTAKPRLLTLPDLAATQRWMQAVIVTPGTCTEAIASPAATSHVPLDDAREIVLPSATLDPEERLDIYRGMYGLRLTEALRTDYPVLAAYLGEDTFSELADLYIRACPSTSYTLNRLGSRLPEFLRNVAGLKHRGFCQELARFERALTEAFDAEETPRLTARDLAVIQDARWASVRLKPAASLRLLDLRFPVQRHCQALRGKKKRFPPVKANRTTLAVYRHRYVVDWIELDPPSWRVLSALVRGATIGRAVSAARVPYQERLDVMYACFREFSSRGLFQGVEKIAAK